MQLAPVIGIAIVLFAFSEILKATVFKGNPDAKAIIPYICTLLGALAGVGLFIINPMIIGTENLLEAILLGAVSGLIATGSFQIYRQFLNLMQNASNIQNEIGDLAHKELTEDDLQKLSDTMGAASDALGNRKEK